MKTCPARHAVWRVVRVAKVSVSWSLVDRCDLDDGEIPHCELAVAGAHRPELLELVDAAFDGMPLPVDDAVEDWWSHTIGAAVAAVGELIGRDRNIGPDPTFAQVGPVGSGTVGLVRQHPIQSRARPDRYRISVPGSPPGPW